LFVLSLYRGNVEARTELADDGVALLEGGVDGRGRIHAALARLAHALLEVRLVDLLLCGRAQDVLCDEMVRGDSSGQRLGG